MLLLEDHMISKYFPMQMICRQISLHKFKSSEHSGMSAKAAARIASEAVSGSRLPSLYSPPATIVTFQTTTDRCSKRPPRLTNQMSLDKPIRSAWAPACDWNTWLIPGRREEGATRERSRGRGRGSPRPRFPQLTTALKGPM